MARTATLTRPKARTHQGGEAAEEIGAKEQLTRAASSTMLFEDTFYEKGDGIAARIAELVGKCSPEDVAEIARLTKNDLKLRHVPLWLAVQLAIKHAGKPGKVIGTIEYKGKNKFPTGTKLPLRGPGSRALIRDLVADVIKRPDELAEIIALYWKAADNDRSKTKGATKIPVALREGVAKAYKKFNEYSLAKWNRDDREVKLKDALFLSHPKADEDQTDLWKRLIADELKTPDTWEVALSGGADKKEAWTRLLSEKKLGAMALLMNLRNMTDAGVDRSAVKDALGRIDGRSKLLPFRFVSAAEFAPAYADELSEAMLRAVEGVKKLGGTTVLVVDNSGSMAGAQMSARSKMNRTAAAGALAILVRQVSDDVRIFSYSDTAVEVKNVRGLPLIDAIRKTPSGGTNTAAALKYAKTKVPDATRVILITDEQAADGIIANWGTKQGYVVNVAPYAPGLETGKNGWQRINGWSERLIDWIAMEETGTALSSDEEDSVASDAAIAVSETTV